MKKDVHVTILKYPKYEGIIIRKDFGDKHFEDEIYLEDFKHYLN
jgi:hypothetical protein